jgi:hypothetical protein
VWGLPFMSSQSSGQSTSQGASQGTSQGTSQGNSASQSANTSFLVPQPALGYEGQWNSALQSLQSQQYQWAQQQFGNNSQLTDQMVSDANNYANPERIQQDMGGAESGVAQGMDAQRQALNQTLQSYGINPGDPKYAGALAASRTAQGAAEAAAGQTANRADVATGNQLKQAAFGDVQQNTNTGAAILGTSPGYANTAVSNVKFAPLGSAGQSTSASQNASNNSAQNSAKNQAQSTNQSTSTQPAKQQSDPSQGSGQGGGSPTGGGGSGGGSGGGASNGNPTGYGGGYGGGGTGQQPGGIPGSNGYPAGSPNGSANPVGDNGTSTGGYGNYPSSANGGGGYYSNAGSANPVGDNGTSTGGYGNYAGGGDVGNGDGGGGIPDGTTGGHVDQDMSPSQGAIVDDVPARLNAEEFVVPRDVARWKGEEFFHQLIDKSRKARQGVTATPEQKPMQLKDAVAHMRGQGFQSKPVSQAFAGGAIPDGSDRPLMQRYA